MTEVNSGHLLVLILDTNPSQPSFLGQNPARFTQWIDGSLAFLNSHLCLNQINEAALISSGSQSSTFLFPREDEVTLPEAIDGQFEGFRKLEYLVRSQLSQIIQQELHGPIVRQSLVAGGLCMALSYINRYLNEREGRKARILVLTAFGASSSHYMNYMNAFFTAQRLGVPIDTCVLERDSGLLQQGSDITGGRYFRLDKIEKFLQVLIWLFLPDTSTRGQLGLPTSANVDYRAACFCHRQLVDIGYVCSVCLSIFCKLTPICSTCQTVFPNMPNMLIKKKKNKNSS